MQLGALFNSIYNVVSKAINTRLVESLPAGTNKIGSVSLEEKFLTVNTIKGIATNGTEIMLIDETKDFEADVLTGKIVKITIDGVDYYRKIISNVVDSFIFPAIFASVAASAIVGDGLDEEGQVTIRCQGILDGAVGNDYSIEIVQGVDTTGDTIVTFDEENKVLLITVNLDGLGNPRLLAAGDMANLIANTVGVSDKFIVDNTFVAGNLPIGGAAIPFVFGVDGIPVVAGTEYEIAVAEKNVTATVTGTVITELTGSYPANATAFSKTDDSEANAALADAIAAVADKKHYVTYFEVVLSGADSTAAITVTLSDGATVKYKTIIGLGAATGTRVGFALHSPMEFSENTAINIAAGAGGTGAITTYNILGYTV